MHVKIQKVISMVKCYYENAFDQLTVFQILWFGNMTESLCAS